MLQPSSSLKIDCSLMFQSKSSFLCYLGCKAELGNIMKLTLIVIVSLNGVFGIGYRYCTDTGQLYKPTKMYQSTIYLMHLIVENLQNQILNLLIIFKIIFFICATNFYDSYFCISIKTRQIFPISENNQQFVSVRKIPPSEVDLKHLKSCNFAKYY